MSAFKGPVTRWINEVIGSLSASVHNRPWKHLRVGSEAEFPTVHAAAEADFTAGVLFSSGPSLAPTEDGAVRHEEDGLVFDELLDDDSQDACPSQAPEELDASEKELLQVIRALGQGRQFPDDCGGQQPFDPDTHQAGVGVPPPVSGSAKEVAISVSALGTAVLDTSVGKFSLEEVNNRVVAWLRSLGCGRVGALSVVFEENHVAIASNQDFHGNQLLKLEAPLGAETEHLVQGNMNEVTDRFRIPNQFGRGGVFWSSSLGHVHRTGACSRNLSVVLLLARPIPIAMKAVFTSIPVVIRATLQMLFYVRVFGS